MIPEDIAKRIHLVRTYENPGQFSTAILGKGKSAFKSTSTAGAESAAISVVLKALGLGSTSFSSFTAVRAANPDDLPGLKVKTGDTYWRVGAKKEFGGAL